MRCDTARQCTAYAQKLTCNDSSAARKKNGRAYSCRYVDVRQVRETLNNCTAIAPRPCNGLPMLRRGLEFVGLIIIIIIIIIIRPWIFAGLKENSTFSKTWHI